MKSRKKTEVLKECKTEEFTRFEKLTKKLVSVRKADIKDAEKKRSSPSLGKTGT